MALLNFSVESGLDKKKFIDMVTDCLSMIEVNRIISADDPSSGSPLEGESLRADQDRAYFASLEADKKKEVERRALEEAKRKAEELELEKVREIAALEEARLNKINVLKKYVQSKCLGSCSDNNAIILSIQFAATGKRATGRFSPSTPVKDVFDYCAAQFEMLPEEISLRIPMPFQLINNDGNNTLEDIGITSNVKLVAEKIVRDK
jgi:FAS-associated factor 2